MDIAFKSQIGRNLEVYMDDLVIKSVEEDQMLRDIEETFETLRSINMKLNPAKCSFGMEEGKFLGVIVTGAGFKANLDKVQVVARMPTPSSIKEVQTLNGRLGCPPDGSEERSNTNLLRQQNTVGPRDKIFSAGKSCLSIGLCCPTPPQEKDLMLQFSSCKVIHIKRSENKSADALSKLASTNFEHFAKDIHIEILDRLHVPQHQVLVIQTGVESWMTPIVAYLSSGVLP
ncbi:uncharacterized protein LOC143592965 [Bidens hawaiensis]|uniref:uncharacterized protein LOC143592965 n=1 Tax=Bidens hawaiensis TaxID=980011 RepID=UPI00404A7D89